MTEEKKEKPDWLSDFQINQDVIDKQICSEIENSRITFDLYSTVVTNASPRYGRRSVTGAKSVENSPKRQSSKGNKTFTVRSCSARPGLSNLSAFPKETFKINRENPDSENYISSLQVLQSDLEDFSLSASREKFGKVFDVENLSNSKVTYDNLEDSWNSLNIFKIKQKGRLVSTEKDVSAKQNNCSFSNSCNQGHQALGESICEGDKNYQNAINKNLENVKNKIKAETLEENWKTLENETVSNTNASKNNSRDFIIPELPQGKTLVFNIKTTWGDKHYLGLNGIEIFNSKGKKIKVKSIEANPPDINILPEYSKDPRVAENLIDNTYLTQDDMHMWLVPFTPNSSHFIYIEFYEMEELAMLRVWNYNKSRIHCFRGAKDVEIKLDSRFIFIGEIAKASGEILNSLNSLGDTILFTTDEEILEMVAENDEYFNYSFTSHLEDNQTSQEEFRPLTGANKEKEIRPFTCPKNNIDIRSVLNSSPQSDGKKEDICSKYFSDGNISGFLKSHNAELEKQLIMNFEDSDSEKPKCLEVKEFIQDNSVKKLITERMSIDIKTKAIVLMEQGTEELENMLLPGGSYDTYKMKDNKQLENDSLAEKSKFLDKNYSLYIPSASFLASDSVYETPSMPTGFTFTIQIHSTWGDAYYVGLNGLKIFDENNAEITLHPSNISADPESVNVLNGINNDARTPDKLIDGINDSIDGCHMWLAPVLPLTINRIELTFENPVTLSSLKLWNYAKTPTRGVREFGILVDGLLIYNGELDQAVIMADGSLPKVPCKTVVFSSPNRLQSNINFMVQKEETFSGMQYSADQSLRPLTTMTSHS